MKSLKLVTPSRMSWPISSSWALPRSVMMQWKAKSVTALSWAFFIQVSKAWRRVWPLYWMAKSMSVVVPPKAAAMVPVWKSSALVVPPKGMSRWVWTSMPPGITRQPVASITRPVFSTGSWAARAVTLSPLMPTSAREVSVAVTTAPLRITVSKRISTPQGRFSAARKRMQEAKRGFPRAFVSVASKGLRLHKNCAILGSFLGAEWGPRKTAGGHICTCKIVCQRSIDLARGICEPSRGGHREAGMERMVGLRPRMSVLEARQDFVLVDIERFFFVAGHQVDIELGDAHLAQAVELLAMLVDGPDQAETVDDFVADELGVVTADFAVMEIIVLAAVLYKGSQRGGQFFGLVFGDEVHHVIGNERGKPADVFACGFQVVGGPHGRGSHHFDFAEVAAGLFCAFAHEAEAPGDQVRVGKLENHAVADAPRGAQGLGAVAGDPHAGNFAIGPGKFCGDAIEIDRFPGVQVAEDADKFLEVFERGGFFPQHAAGAVAAANAQFHASLRGQIEGGEQAG